MEGERKSVFERLGTIRPKQSGGNSVQGNAIRGGHDLKREDLRHRVLHLTKRRSHHPGQISQYHQHNMGLKRAKFNHPEPPTLPPPQPKTIRRRRKKPRVIDEENLDEGEIIDDEDDWEEYDECEDEEEEGEIDFKKDSRPKLSALPEGDSISFSSFSDNNDDHQKENDQSIDNSPSGKVTIEVGEIRIKEEIIDDDESRQSAQTPAQVGSDYSDWSDGEDDELLKLENTEQKAREKRNAVAESARVIKEEIEDSMDATKSIEDLEAISDDDLDPMSDDFFDKSESQTDMDDLLNKSDSLSQFVDGNTSASATSTSNEVSGDMKVLDILEIDWKSLITEKRQGEAVGNATVESSTPDARDSHAEYRHRNSTISLLNRIGFSHSLAGPQLTTYIEAQLAEKLKDQYVPMYDSLPALHCYFREKRELREGFFKSAQELPSTSSSNGVPSLPLNGAKIEAFSRMAF